MRVILIIAVHCIASVALLFEARCLNVWLFTRVEYDKSLVSVWCLQTVEVDFVYATYLNQLEREKS